MCLALALPHAPPTDKEAKLLAEIDGFGRGRTPTPADLDSAFSYAAAVLQEALRLYPPASQAVRESKPGMALGGLQVPPGTALQVRGCQAACWEAAAGLTLRPPTLLHPARCFDPPTVPSFAAPRCSPQVNLYALHRSKLWWKDPDAFLPERFLAGSPEAAEVRSRLGWGTAARRPASERLHQCLTRTSCAQVVPGAYHPFGDGARKCIGLKFAQQEALLALVQLYSQVGWA